jgi:importin subunit beta-1
VAIVLQQAATVTLTENGAFEMLDYIISLREGIMDAWSGIILALKQGKGLSLKVNCLHCLTAP